MAIPKLISFAMVKIVEYLDGDPEKDSNGEIIYQDGRKTIHSFGNRRFAIEKGFWEGKTTLNLFDRKENKDIDRDIEGYHCEPCMYKKGGKGYECASQYVYTKGKKGYTKLNYETAEMKQSLDITEFSAQDQEIFNKISP